MVQTYVKYHALNWKRFQNEAYSMGGDYGRWTEELRATLS